MFGFECLVVGCFPSQESIASLLRRLLEKGTSTAANDGELVHEGLPSNDLDGKFP